MVWVGGALDVNTGSCESESLVEDDCSEGMSLLVVGAVVAVPAGEGRRWMSCWQRSVREMSLSVRRWCLWQTREGDVGCDRVCNAGADRSAGVGATVGRLEGLRWLCCLGEEDSDARGAIEFGLLYLVSGI